MMEDEFKGLRSWWLGWVWWLSRSCASYPETFVRHDADAVLHATLDTDFDQVRNSSS